jgi:hypothetical protein
MNVLKPGGIILTTSAAPVSKGNRFATGSDISRAEVCVEGYSGIDDAGKLALLVVREMAEQ